MLLCKTFWNVSFVKKIYYLGTIVVFEKNWTEWNLAWVTVSIFETFFCLSKKIIFFIFLLWIERLGHTLDIIVFIWKKRRKSQAICNWVGNDVTHARFLCSAYSWVDYDKVVTFQALSSQPIYSSRLPLASDALFFLFDDEKKNSANVT